MGRTGWCAVLAVAVAGCAPTVQDRVRDYNDDGVFLYERGSYDRARASFEAALALQPNDPNLLFNVGQCYDNLGRYDRAETFYNECLQRVPDHAACRHALTVLLDRQGRRAEAFQKVEAWLASRPRLAAAYVEDGYLWYRQGDLRRAQGRLYQALELDPRDVRALTELAQVYEDLHWPDRAVVLYERVLDYSPHYPGVEQRLSELRAQGVGRPRRD
jgi:tetratricopeptide (TPR) repeat protein